MLGCHFYTEIVCCAFWFICLYIYPLSVSCVLSTTQDVEKDSQHPMSTLVCERFFLSKSLIKSHFTRWFKIGKHRMHWCAFHWWIFRSMILIGTMSHCWAKMSRIDKINPLEWYGQYDTYIYTYIYPKNQTILLLIFDFWPMIQYDHKFLHMGFFINNLWICAYFCKEL